VCGRLVIVAADVPCLSMHSLHNIGRHHHATQALLDASHVSYDISARIQAGLLAVLSVLVFPSE